MHCYVNKSGGGFVIFIFFFMWASIILERIVQRKIFSVRSFRVFEYSSILHKLLKRCIFSVLFVIYLMLCFHFKNIVVLTTSPPPPPPPPPRNSPVPSPWNSGRNIKKDNEDTQAAVENRNMNMLWYGIECMRIMKMSC